MAPTPLVPAPGRALPIPEAAAWPVVVRAGSARVVTAAPSEVVVADGASALAALDDLEPGWWAGYLAYDLGRAVESVRPRLTADPALPDLVLARYDARLVADATGMRLEGKPRSRDELDRLLDRSPTPGSVVPPGDATSSLDRESFEAGVRAVVALIENGDCYQVNLTRRLSWDAAVDPVALHHALETVNPSPRGALFVLPTPRGDIGVVSATPERFLAWRGLDIETRPIKGTAADEATLRASAKDHAENVMIVDLARNDLGRVAEFGSVEVSDLFGIEHHPGLVHLVSTVRARRTAGTGVGALVGATFPPASVTGAPKPRVLQAIEDLEPVRRGIYCGAIGWIDTTRDEADLSVAIRTFATVGGSTTLGVGGGIVADSDPSAEWAETELKAHRLLAAAGAVDPRERVDRERRHDEPEHVVTEHTVWVDGSLVPADEARVSPFDHGLLVGDGVFETMRVYGGIPFAWRRHIERLAHSAAGLGLDVPDAATLRAAAEAVLAANGLVEGRVRITVTGGPSPLGSERGESPPTVIVAANEAKEWPAAERVVTVPWPRNERGATAGLKTISYAENVRALAYAHDHDATEAIFLNTRGELCEATGSNVFIVQDMELITPPVETGCLLGVTRALVLELCPELGIEVSERLLPGAALQAADEAFLTSTTREVQPISHVDGRAIAATPGPVTARLAKEFSALVARDPDP